MKLKCILWLQVLLYRYVYVLEHWIAYNTNATGPNREVRTAHFNGVALVNELANSFENIETSSLVLRHILMTKPLPSTIPLYIEKSTS